MTAPPPFGMRTVTGRFVSYEDPDPSEIEPFDIAHSLSQSGRFCGQTMTPCNTAMHSVLVSTFLGEWLSRQHLAVSGQILLAALLHDAAEAYMADVPYPLHVMAGEGRADSTRKQVQRRLEGAIAARFDFDVRHFADPNIAHVDRALPYIEMRLLQANPAPVPDEYIECAGWMSTHADRISRGYALPATAARDIMIARLNGLRVSW